jgi:hypothetical protein
MGGRNEEGERSQPFMMPPFVTFNVMLARVLRFDLCRQQNSTVDTTYSYGCLRGLEFIPTTRLEFGIFEPDYMVHSANVPNGFSDFTYSVKFRAFSRRSAKAATSWDSSLVVQLPPAASRMGSVTRPKPQPSP